MPRQSIGPRPLTGAERQAHQRQKQKAQQAAMQTELERLNTIIHQLAAEGVQACAAMRELLTAHDTLYRAHFGPDSDPTDDIAAKAARAFLDE